MATAALPARATQPAAASQLYRFTVPQYMKLIGEGFFAHGMRTERLQLGLMLARSVPEPELAVVRGPARKYRRQHPRGADTVLIIEVADDSLDDDRRQKGPIYAAARIPEYWIVNVVDFQVEVYTQPRAGKSPRYRQRKDYSGKASVPLILDGKEIAKLSVTDLLAGLMPETEQCR